MQVYQGRLTVDGLLESMVACRQGSPRDRQLFQAVLNVIYEEFQFLHNFPDKELQMTAQVLASLVSARRSPAPFMSVARGWPARPTLSLGLAESWPCSSRCMLPCPEPAMEDTIVFSVPLQGGRASCSQAGPCAFGTRQMVGGWRGSQSGCMVGS